MCMRQGVACGMKTISGDAHEIQIQICSSCRRTSRGAGKGCALWAVGAWLLLTASLGARIIYAVPFPLPISLHFPSPTPLPTPSLCLFVMHDEFAGTLL